MEQGTNKLRIQNINIGEDEFSRLFVNLAPLEIPNTKTKQNKKEHNYLLNSDIHHNFEVCPQIIFPRFAHWKELHNRNNFSICNVDQQNAKTRVMKGTLSSENGNLLLEIKGKVINPSHHSRRC